MRKKLIILGIFLLVILLMPIGYSLFSTHTTIDGVTEITGDWNIKIKSIVPIEVSENCDAGTPEFTDTSATFAAKLHKPGDSVTYLVTIENSGNIDAVLNNILFTSLDNEASPISYETSEVAHELKAGEETTFKIKAIFDENVTENVITKTKKVVGIIDYVQK